MPAFDLASTNRTLFQALLDAAKKHGANKQILVDQDKKPLTYKRLILASFVLGAKLISGTKPGDVIGLLLPNANAMPICVFGLNAFGRVAALLNFTSGLKNLRSAVKTGQITRIVTSRRFIDHARLDDVIAGLAEPDAANGRSIEIIYLEDVARSISTADKAVGLLRSLAPGLVHAAHRVDPQSPAIILFTSGTEGAPKGVALSNRNLVANTIQVWQHADGHLSPDDRVLNALPMFHCFGLTASTLMPLFNGMEVILYPSPLHYRQIPKLIGETKATVLISTDTFLQGYARAAEGHDLATIRFVVAGAERVREQTCAMWAKYGTLLLEGYGATECAPVLAVNLPSDNRPGTVGRMLPGIETKLVPVEGIAEGGRLMVRGPNVMLGYMLADRPGVIVPPHDGWHDTGDIVSFNGDGFVAIKGRAKRFAKIGGEMVSLAAIEAMAASLWPDANNVVVAMPDARKGEQLVLVTNRADADKEDLMRHARAQGFPELWIPKAVLVVGEIPVLGSGKVDMPATMELVARMRTLL